MLKLHYRITPVFVSQFYIFVVITLFIMNLTICIDPSDQKAVLIIKILFFISVPYISIKHLLAPVKIFLINAICGTAGIYKYFGDLS